MRAARFEQGARQPQRVGHHHVVVGHAVHEQQRPLEARGERCEIRALVVARLVPWIAEVALGVVRVVQPPFGDRRAGHCGVEHVGPAQHGECREIPAERPSANRDPREIEMRMTTGHLEERHNLIVERMRREVTADRALPGGAARRRAASVAHDHREALVGEPLRRCERVRSLLHAQCVRPAIGIEQHGQQRVTRQVAG